MSWFAKMIFDEGGALKNPKKSKGYLLKSLNFSKCFFQLFIKKIKNIYKKLTFAAYDKIEGEGSRATYRSRFCNLLSSVQETCINHKFNLLNSKGSILIEFAVCMPVLIILLYYINDLSKLKRYYDQTEFVCQQFVNIIQNISQNREGDDKRIRREDLEYAGSLAWLSVYPGNTLYHNASRSSSSRDLSHSPEFMIYYVRGEAENKATTVWCKYIWGSSNTTPKNWGYSNASDNSRGFVKWGNKVEPSAIHPKLTIKEGEVKIIVECFLYSGTDVVNTSSSSYSSKDNQDTRGRKALRLMMVTPKNCSTYTTSGYYAPSIEIFTPQPGLFSETRP